MCLRVFSLYTYSCAEDGVVMEVSHGRLDIPTPTTPTLPSGKPGPKMLTRKKPPSENSRPR